MADRFIKTDVVKIRVKPEGGRTRTFFAKLARRTDKAALWTRCDRHGVKWGRQVDRETIEEQVIMTGPDHPSEPLWLDKHLGDLVTEAEMKEGR